MPGDHQGPSAPREPAQHHWFAQASMFPSARVIPVTPPDPRFFVCFDVSFSSEVRILPFLAWGKGGTFYLTNHFDQLDVFFAFVYVVGNLLGMEPRAKEHKEQKKGKDCHQQDKRVQGGSVEIAFGVEN